MVSLPDKPNTTLLLTNCTGPKTPNHKKTMTTIEALEIAIDRMPEDASSQEAQKSLKALLDQLNYQPEPKPEYHSPFKVGDVVYARKKRTGTVFRVDIKPHIYTDGIFGGYIMIFCEGIGMLPEEEYYKRIHKDGYFPFSEYDFTQENPIK